MARRQKQGATLAGANGADVHARIQQSCRFGEATRQTVEQGATISIEWLASGGMFARPQPELGHIAGLTGLKSLSLTGTSVSDEGLVHLQRFTKIEHLALGGTRVSDVGLKHLSGLKELRFLVLSHTDVSDDGLESKP